jgi:hypothetical protein
MDLICGDADDGVLLAEVALSLQLSFTDSTYTGINEIALTGPQSPPSTR